MAARPACEDRIRNAKDTGLTNLPLHDLNQNRIWCAVVSLACELLAWLQLLALVRHPARRWEPKRLRLRLFSAAARLAVSGRRTVLHLSAPAGGATYCSPSTNDSALCPAPPADPPPPAPTTQRSGPWNRRTERPRTIPHTPKGTISQWRPPWWCASGPVGLCQGSRTGSRVDHAAAVARVR